MLTNPRDFGECLKGRQPEAARDQLGQWVDHLIEYEVGREVLAIRAPSGPSDRNAGAPIGSVFRGWFGIPPRLQAECPRAPAA